MNPPSFEEAFAVVAHAAPDAAASKCAGLHRPMDALAYELYGLTPDEIENVESAAA